MKQLGMRLRALREGIGLSQSKFADVIGSTQSSINRYISTKMSSAFEGMSKKTNENATIIVMIFAIIPTKADR